MTNRPVDEAMAAAGQAKAAVREIWADKVTDRQPSVAEGFPLYTSLTGPEALDIEVLLQREIIRSNAVGGIAEDDLDKLVAIERSSSAVLELQRRHPGLKIIEKDVRSLVGTENPFNWPGIAERRYCAALVLNLDFQQALQIQVVHGELFFPQLRWIEKIAQIQHQIAVHPEWTLLLTLNATPAWGEAEQVLVCAHIFENGQAHPPFREHLNRLLNDEALEVLDEGVPFVDALTPEQLQRLLCVLVPKLLAERTVPVGWSLVIEWSLLYNSEAGAPMVTFVVDFDRAGPGPSLTARLNSSLSAFATGVQEIEEDGSFQEL